MTGTNDENLTLLGENNRISANVMCIKLHVTRYANLCRITLGTLYEITANARRKSWS